MEETQENSNSICFRQFTIRKSETHGKLDLCSKRGTLGSEISAEFPLAHPS